MRITTLLLIILSVLLSACGDTEYRRSDMNALDASETKLPKSTLDKADTKLKADLQASKPAFINHQRLTEEVGRVNGSFGVESIEWTPEVTSITIQAKVDGGSFWYKEKYKCSISGFWGCKSGYYVDYQFKLKGADDKKYVLDRIKNYPREYNETNENGDTRTVKRDRAVLDAGTYQMLFLNVPKEALREVDLYEDYCTDGGNVWSLCDIHTPYFYEERQEHQALQDFFTKKNLNALPRAYLDQLIQQYAKYPQVTQHFVKAIYTRTSKTNNIEELHAFVEHFDGHQKLVERATVDIYKLIKTKDTVAAYEWFIEAHPNTSEALSAVTRIHQIMFANAQELDTVNAYNTFVINYPSAKQRQQAMSLAMEIEREIYTDYGLFGFINNDDEKEKKARKLLIRAKQIERMPQEKSFSENSTQSSGYYIVADRMYDLLQQEFDESDATLRHLESEEFKHFSRTLMASIKRIQSTLSDIRANTRQAARYAEESVKVARNGFNDASADRAMATFYSQQHQQWEKNMHFRDYGYL